MNHCSAIASPKAQESSRPRAVLWQLLMLCALTLLHATAWAADAALGDVTPAELRYMNRHIYTMRSMVAGATPEQRAERAVERLRALTPDQLSRPVQQTEVAWNGERAIALRVGDTTLLKVFARDLDPEIESTLEEVALTSQTRLQEALAVRRQLGEPGLLAKGLAMAVGGLIVAVLLAWGVLRARRLITGRLKRLVEQGASSHRLFGLDWSPLALGAVTRSVQAVTALVLAFVAYLWVGHVLRQFPVTKPLADGMGLLIVQGAVNTGAALWGVLPDLLMVGLIFGIGKGVVAVVNRLFAGVEAGRLRVPGIHPETARATLRLATFGVWGLALAAAYPFIPGSQSNVFRGLSIFLGFMVTLGSSGIVSQWMHGLVIVYSRALRVGEFVRMGAVEGRVKELGTLSVKVIDHRGDEVTVPNTTVIGGSVLNFTRMAATGTEHGVATVSIGYDVPWRQVVELLQEAARRTEGLRSQPGPVVLQRVLSDFAVEFELIVQIELPAARSQRMSSLNDSIRDVFDAAGVQILSPHYFARAEPAATDTKVPAALG